MKLTQENTLEFIKFLHVQGEILDIQKPLQFYNMPRETTSVLIKNGILIKLDNKGNEMNSDARRGIAIWKWKNENVDPSQKMAVRINRTITEQVAARKKDYNERKKAERQANSLQAQETPKVQEEKSEELFPKFAGVNEEPKDIQPKRETAITTDWKLPTRDVVKRRNIDDEFKEEITYLKEKYQTLFGKNTVITIIAEIKKSQTLEV